MSRRGSRAIADYGGVQQVAPVLAGTFLVAGLATLSLPSDWMAAASGGSKAKSGTWQDTSADNSGTALHFRIYDSGGATCHLQGTVTVTGGGGDLTVDSVSFTAGQSFTITAFTLTEGNS